MSTGLTNWSGNLTYGAATVLRPRTVAELQEIVAREPRVRALGTRHSFSAVADTSGTLVSLSDLAPDIVVDAELMTASVTGGTSYGVFAAALQEQGFALPNMGSLPHISVAGATATGTHGSGDGNGILATAISAVELVTADGSLVTVDGSNGDLAALAVGLGAFGVIARLTFDIQPTYLVRQDIYLNAPWDLVLDRLDEVMASAYSVSLMGSYSGPTIQQLWQKVRLGDGEPPVIADSLYRRILVRRRPRARRARASTSGAACRGRGRTGCRTSGSTRCRQSAVTNCRANGSSGDGMPLRRCGCSDRWPSRSTRTCTQRRSAAAPATSCGSAPPTSGTACASASPGASTRPRSVR